MRKFLLYSSALVVLSGVAEAACIQTPTCSSLGYTSSSSCTGGVKCPFGNAWNCTGPNNTTEINKLKTEISSIKTDITNIKTNITNLTNRITNIENNSSSNQYSDKCIGCEVGMYYDGTKCYTIGELSSRSEVNLRGYVTAKTDGKCYYFPFGTMTKITYNEWLELKDDAEASKMWDTARYAIGALQQRGVQLACGLVRTQNMSFQGPTSGRYYAYFTIEYYGNPCWGITQSAESAYGQSLEDFKNSLTVPWFPETKTF